MYAPLLLFACLGVIGFDLVARRVPNRFLIVVTAMQCALLANHGDSHAGWQACAGLVLGLFGMLPFYIMHLMGAGDVKFAALLGLMLGPVNFIGAWLIAGLCAGIHSVTTLMLRNNGIFLAFVGDRIKQAALWHRLERVRAGRKGIPYAAYLGIGAVVMVFVR